MKSASCNSNWVVCVRVVACLAGAWLACPASAALREEHFDEEPVGWEGINHRSRAFAPKTVTQDFGYTPSTRHAGGRRGEVGGRINPAGEAAYYGYRLPKPLSLDSSMTVLGRLYVARGSGHVLLGFFNTNALNEWRTPNTLAVRVNQAGKQTDCRFGVHRVDLSVNESPAAFASGMWRR